MKTMVERAAELERRSLTDFCLAALVRASEETLARHESLALTERDRAAFFDALVHAPEPNERAAAGVQGCERGDRCAMMADNAEDYRAELLGKEHDRAGFACGVESLDQYLKTQASQDVRRKANAVFAMVPEGKPSTIAGYFTLCAVGLEPGAIPDEAKKHLPRYPQVSATLIGRLAVSREFQGRGLGAVLLATALRKAFENADIVGSCMVVVDAIDDRAARFYRAHGFVQLQESSRLILPMQTIGKLIAGSS